MKNATTLTDLLLRFRAQWGGRPALFVDWSADGSTKYSASTFLNQVHSLALTLESQGLEKGQTVALFSSNRLEWVVVDFACHLLGAIVVPIYPSLSDRQIGYIMRNSGVSLLFFSGQKEADRLEPILRSLPTRPRLVSMDSAVEGSLVYTDLVYLYAEKASSRGVIPLEKFRDRVTPSDPASLVYTVGTAGNPKGAILTHGAMLASLQAQSAPLQVTENDVALSFLPLSHSEERNALYHYLAHGAEIHFLRDPSQLRSLMPTIAPTILGTVPSTWDAWAAIIHRRREEDPKTHKNLTKALDYEKRSREEGSGGAILRTKQQMVRRTLEPLRHSLFGHRLRLALVGGSGFSRANRLLFNALGLPLRRTYGYTESGGWIALSPSESTEGGVEPLATVEINISPQGEIGIRSPTLMTGYWKDRETTSRRLDEEGFFRPGDFGRVENSVLYPGGRVDNLAMMSSGKTFSPENLEKTLIASPWIAQAVVIAHSYPFPIALLCPDWSRLATHLHLDSLGPEETDLIREPIQRAIAGINENQPPHLRIRGFHLLEKRLSMKMEELSLLGLPRRETILKRYHEIIEKLFVEAEPST